RRRVHRRGGLGGRPGADAEAVRGAARAHLHAAARLRALGTPRARAGIGGAPPLPGRRRIRAVPAPARRELTAIRAGLRRAGRGRSAPPPAFDRRRRVRTLPRMGAAAGGALGPRRAALALPLREDRLKW